MITPMKSILTIAAAALLLSACASSTSGNENTASAREERYTPIGTYLPRKKGQTANNAGAVSEVERENMKNTGVGTGAFTQH
jgi:ABC-type Fe3+-hydroxamate transport system substrate-binding protein